MRALFVDILEDLYDRQGIYPLAAALKQAGHDTYYLCSSRTERLINRICELKPHLVMYSSFSHTLPAYADFDARLKQRYKVISIIGGSGPTFNPAYIDNTTINAACIGEGDLALPEFIASGFQPVKNIYVRGKAPCTELNPLVNLDDLPIPDRNIIYSQDTVRANIPSKQFISGRGCPFLCTYCFNHSYNNIIRNYGEIIRKKSVDYLCEELDSVRRSYPLNLVLFNDDTFIVKRDWFFEFCETYPSRIGIQYGCNIRANLIDEEIVRALKASNCVAINWSIEAGDAFIRNSILKRHITDEQIIETAALLNKYGIRHRIGNLIGLPGETRAQMMKTVELNIRTKPVYALANIFVPYPGLDLTRYAVENGYYTEIPEEKLPKGYFSHSALNIPDEENRWIQKLLYIFPLFVKFPLLYHNLFARSTMFMLPKIIMRPVYELFYGLMFRKVYKVNSTPWNNLRFYMRYLKSILWIKK